MFRSGVCSPQHERPPFGQTVRRPDAPGDPLLELR
jgi:hypothetical protein